MAAVVKVPMPLLWTMEGVGSGMTTTCTPRSSHSTAWPGERRDLTAAMKAAPSAGLVGRVSAGVGPFAAGTTDAAAAAADAAGAGAEAAGAADEGLGAAL